MTVHISPALIIKYGTFLVVLIFYVDDCDVDDDYCDVDDDYCDVDDGDCDAHDDCDFEDDNCDAYHCDQAADYCYGNLL